MHFFYEILQVLYRYGVYWRKKSTKIKALAVPAKKKSKFYDRRYSDKTKDIISKVADWVKLAIEKQKRGERLILSDSFYLLQDRHVLYVKFQNPLFIELPEEKRKFIRTKMKSRKLTKMKSYLIILIR